MSSQKLALTQRQQAADKWHRRRMRWEAWKKEQTKAKAEEMALERNREER